MAITQNKGIQLETDIRDNLLKSDVDKSLTRGGSKDKGGEALAGITASFASNVTGEIENYISNVDDAISEMEAVEATQAFQGQGINEAMIKFVQSVKNTATAYTNKLKEAENQIINSVENVYSQNDQDIASQLGQDGQTLEANNPQPH